ncbi:MAG TPA: hypothetical protein PK156_33605 [Polyangium sp.]|nr:hypothetical protein [Polyangium sp.]
MEEFLTRNQWESDACPFLADVLVDAFVDSNADAPSHQSSADLVVSPLRWIIRDDDLKLVDAFSDALKVAVAAALLDPNGHEHLKALTASFTFVVKLIHQIRRKGATLPPHLFEVIKLLHNVPNGLLLDDMLAKQTEPRMTPDELQEALGTLGNILLSDGTKVSFVLKDPVTHKWRLSGI